jgi:uncharacterized protein YecE (DUF72 family)
MMVVTAHLLFCTPWSTMTVAKVYDPFQRQPVHGKLAYFRLHGKGGYRYRYNDEDLVTLLEWCRPYGEAYCLFNNVSMWDDAMRCREMLGNG